jgi:hypothetical protein
MRACIAAQALDLAFGALYLGHRGQFDHPGFPTRIAHPLRSKRLEFFEVRLRFPLAV